MCFEMFLYTACIDLYIVSIQIVKTVAIFRSNETEIIKSLVMYLKEVENVMFEF